MRKLNLDISPFTTSISSPLLKCPTTLFFCSPLFYFRVTGNSIPFQSLLFYFRVTSNSISPYTRQSRACHISSLATTNDIFFVKDIDKVIKPIAKHVR